LRPMSRPLRALVLIVLLWGASRGAVIWHDAMVSWDVPRPLESSHHILAVVRGVVPATGKLGLAASPPHRPMAHPGGPAGLVPDAPQRRQALPATRDDTVQWPVLPSRSEPAPDLARVALETPRLMALPALPLVPNADARSAPHARLSLSGWALARAAGAASLSDNGQLGGSQTGLRALYIPNTSRLGLTARLSAPLDQPLGKEAALGLAFRPSHAVPLTLILEQRIAADSGGRTDLELLVTGGLYDRRISGHLLFSGYAQAGVVGLKSRDGFVDGAAEIEHALVRIGAAKLSVGGGAWGAAQPHIARFDLGPELNLRTGLGPAQIKLSASYRVRVVGEARPATGPALSVGTNF